MEKLNAEFHLFSSHFIFLHFFLRHVVSSITLLNVLVKIYR